MEPITIIVVVMIGLFAITALVAYIRHGARGD